MYSDKDIRAAVEAGVMPKQTANAFRDFIQQQRGGVLNQDQEYIPLVHGFNDIFVVIAAVIALAGLWTIGNTMSPLIGGGLVAVASWLLSEYFTRRRHMALPSIVLLVTALGGTFGGVIMQLLAMTVRPDLASGVAFIAASAVATAHWFRFRVPITLAAGIATVVGIIVSFLSTTWLLDSILIDLVIMTGGLVTFGIAMSWDASDVDRTSRRSDVAFWLHLLAAPLMIHPLFNVILGSDFEIGVTQAAATLVVYVVLSVVSLIIDRRALMVSALAYVIFIFSQVLTSVGLVDLGSAVMGLIVGAGLLLVSVFWHPLRSSLVSKLPPALLNKLPSLQ